MSCPSTLNKIMEIVLCIAVKRDLFGYNLLASDESERKLIA